jgi:protein O-GlcNAc transferase
MIEADLQRAVVLQRDGRLGEAERVYRAILKAAPDHFDALHLLGVLKHQQGCNAEALGFVNAALRTRPHEIAALSNCGVILGELGRFDEALACYARAVALKPDYAEGHFNRGLALGELGRLEEALASYDKAIALRPNYADALNNRGNVLRTLDRFEEAVANYDKAIACAPAYAEAFSNRGNALRQLQRFAQALASYDKAIALKPDNAEAFYNRAIALKELKRLDEALVSYDRAITLRPMDAAAFYNRGNLLKELGRFEEALTSYDKALTLKRDYAESFNNRGVVLHELARLDEAVASYDRAIACKPGYAEARSNRGMALRELNRFEEALASCTEAIALDPSYAEAHYNLGVVYMEQGRNTEAAAQFERALAIKPVHVEAKFGLCMAQLSVIYTEEGEIAERRAAYGKCLEALCSDFQRVHDHGGWTDAVGASQPFLLAYQGQNDRELQKRYGELVCRVVAERYPPVALCPPPHAGEKVRLGFVSGFFHQHSNWQIPIKGWLSQLDRSQFRVFGYHTGTIRDVETGKAAGLCERFVHGPLSIDGWREAILSDAPHVLIYPEVGMDPVTAQLAAQRLAAVQCTSWGHPDTSGYPTLDYYLSSDLMEPPDAQLHYTERLVRLPNLSIYYEPQEVPSVVLDRAELGLRPGATVYWSGQSLFKYLPQFDQVFPRIAQEVGDCQFVFIQYQRGTYLNDLFLRRLERSFAACGLKAADYCVLLPRLDLSRFIAAIGLCDIVLDTPGWSGCNSTLQSLQHNLPIVTMPGPLMRGRHTMAMLKMMDEGETVTGTLDDYVRTAVGLARDQAWRATAGGKISQNKSRLYRDASCVSALEEFLNKAARGDPQN